MRVVAVKANDDLVILKLLSLLGTGFDCASKAEIEKVMSLGVEAHRIVYAHPCKHASYMKFAQNVGVDLMTFDNENELRKTKSCFSASRMLLRILPPATDKIQSIVGNKFGCPVNDIRKLLQLAKVLDLNVVGVSFHVGSGCYDVKAFRNAVEDAHQAFKMAAEMGFDMTILDVGGGFPGSLYAKITIQEIAAVMNSALDELFPADSGVQIIAEPGRYFTASACTLTTNVIAKRVICDEADDGNSCIMYYVNDGTHGCVNYRTYVRTKIIPMVPAFCQRPGCHEFSSSIFGPTCDGEDCIIENFRMPELEDGDWICFLDMGAYTEVTSSGFNGMPRPRVYYVAKLDLQTPELGSLPPELPAAELLELCQKTKSMTFSVIKKPCPIVIQ